MGEVLAVRDPELGRLVAAKVMRDDTPGPARERFLREARITGQLEHPNIVPVYELGATAEGARYFTMKRVQGETLAALIERSPAVPAGAGRWLAEALPMFQKVCDAVAFAHSKGAIHRDLKPANIAA